MIIIAALAGLDLAEDRLDFIRGQRIQNEMLRTTFLRLLPNCDDLVASHTSMNIAAASGPPWRSEQGLNFADSFDILDIVVRIGCQPGNFFAGITARPADGTGIRLVFPDTFRAIVENNLVPATGNAKRIR